MKRNDSYVFNAPCFIIYDASENITKMVIYITMLSQPAGPSQGTL
jgi:hypothetical protein